MERHDLVIGVMALAVFGCSARDLGNSIDAPIPSSEMALTVDTLPRLPETTVNAPIEFELSAALRFLERHVPTKIGDIEQRVPLGEESRTQVAYEVKRGPFRLSGRGTTFYLGATIEYMAKGWYDPPVAPAVSGSCGTTDVMPRAQVIVAIDPVITPDWKIGGVPRLVSLEPATDTERDQCEITFLNIDITKTVLNAAREIMEQKLRDFATQLAAVGIRERANEFWTVVQQPVALEDSVWLLVNPQRIRLSPLQVKGDRAHGFIGVDARPSVVAGPRPPAGEVPLGKLGTGPQKPHFSLTIEGRLGYFLFQRELQKELIGDEVKLPGGVIRILNVTVSPADSGRIAVGVKLGGATAATMYFIGRLECDNQGRVDLVSFDYAVTTAGLMVRGVAWLKATELKEYLQTTTLAAVRTAFDHLTNISVQGMNRDILPGITLKTTLNRSQLTRILLLRDGAVVHAEAEGAANLVVSDKFLELLWH